MWIFLDDGIFYFDEKCSAELINGQRGNEVTPWRLNFRNSEPMAVQRMIAIPDEETGKAMLKVIAKGLSMGGRSVSLLAEHIEKVKQEAS